MLDDGGVSGMPSATGSTGSLKAQLSFFWVIIFLRRFMHCFCHWRVHAVSGLFHSHCDECDFSNSLISVLVRGRLVPSARA